MSTIDNAVEKFLAENPEKFVKTEKAPATKGETIPVDRYGLRVTSKMHNVNATIGVLADKGRKDVLESEKAAEFVASMSGFGTTKEKVQRVRQHLSWFNKKMIWSDTKGDYIKRLKVPAKTLAAILAEKAAENQAIIKTTKIR